MEFEWDPRKAKENLRKHGVDFADAVIALEDENALTIEDPDHDELRCKTLGMGPTQNVYLSFTANNPQIAFELFLRAKQIRKKPRYIFKA